jgi:hypothetical protein
MTTENSQYFPLPVRNPENETLDFFDALRQVRDGRRITKLEWDDPACFLQMLNGHLMIYKPSTAKYHDLIVSDGDMFGEDWIVTE